MIINLRPKEEIRRAQVMTANFVWDKDPYDAEALRQMLDCLGLLGKTGLERQKRDRKGRKRLSN